MRRILPGRFCGPTLRNIPDIFLKHSFAKEIALSWELFCAVKRTRCRFCSPALARICSNNFMVTASSPASGSERSRPRWTAPARRLPEGRGLRILEIGAGTGGLASQVLPLLERGLHSYIFTDVSAAFFSAAQQKLAAYPGSGVQDLRSRKTGRRAGAGSGLVRLHHRDQCFARGERCARRITKSARPARARRKSALHGYRHAATLDGNSLRTNEWLVAFHRSRSASRTAAARTGRNGKWCCERPASARRFHCRA